MGQSVDEFRAKALNRHLICEMNMNTFITKYFFEPIGFMTEFKDIIPDNLSFSRKINIIEKIFKDRLYNEKICSCYTTLKIENQKIVALKMTNGKELTVNRLIKMLKMINTIRNHLAHNLVINTSGNLLVPTGLRIDMNYRGDQTKLESAFNYTKTFFKTLEQSRLSKTN